MSYRVFHRTWWRRGPNGSRVPGAGKRHTIAARVGTEDEARAICRAWNASHDPGFLSDKAEYEER